MQAINDYVVSRTLEKNELVNQISSQNFAFLGQQNPRMGLPSSGMPQYQPAVSEVISPPAYGAPGYGAPPARPTGYPGYGGYAPAPGYPPQQPGYAPQARPPYPGYQTQPRYPPGGYGY